MQHIITKQDLCSGFRKAGLAEGQIVLAHSSLKSLGRVEGGADAVIEALLEVLGDSGTLLLPTFTGSAQLSPGHPPVFDVRKTPCWTGLIPETARMRPGALRSLHPTHSVAAFGARAAEMIRDHEYAETPCGWSTPFGRLIENNGLVFFIGVTLDCCTLCHAFEEFAGVNYHMQPDFVEADITDSNGLHKKTRIKIHWYNAAAPRNFPILEPALKASGAMTATQLGGATLRLAKAREMHGIAMKMLSTDPLALLSRDAPLVMASCDSSMRGGVKQ